MDIGEHLATGKEKVNESLDNVFVTIFSRYKGIREHKEDKGEQSPEEMATDKKYITGFQTAIDKETCCKTLIIKRWLLLIIRLQN